MRVYPHKRVTPKKFFLDEIWPGKPGDPRRPPILVLRKRVRLGIHPKIVYFGVLFPNTMSDLYKIAERYCHLLNLLYKPRKRFRK